MTDAGSRRAPSGRARIRRLRGQGRWAEAADLAGDDDLLRAELLIEGAQFARSETARAAAVGALDRVEARLEMGRGRVLHASFLAERGAEDPRELTHFEASLAAARRADDPLLIGWARFWISLVHQVIRDDHATALPHLEAAYEAAREHGDTRLAAYAVRHLAFAWEEGGRLDEAWAGFQESVALRRADRFWPGVAAGLLTLAQAADRRGRPAEARRFLRQARAVGRRSGATAFLARAAELEARLDDEAARVRRGSSPQRPPRGSGRRRGASRRAP